MWTQDEARRELLRRLLDAYEGGSAFWSPGPWARDVVVRLDAVRGAATREAFRQAAEALEREGVARVARSRGGEPKELRLGTGEVATAMAAAGDAGLERLGEALEEVAETAATLRRSLVLPDWMDAYLDRVEKSARNANLAPLGMTRSALKAAQREVTDALTAATFLSRGVTGTERSLSVQIFGDPKRFGAVRARVADLLRRADPRWRRRRADPKQVLGAYRVSRTRRTPAPR